MSAHPSPVPPEQQSPHEGNTPVEQSSGAQRERANRVDRNVEEQGRQGNIKQNTTNPGRQRDR
jgi:hypothetical protein